MEKQTQPDRFTFARAAGPAVGANACRVGTDLRDARERLGVPLETAASDLKIRADYLRNLERDNHAALPALPYTLGFVRRYATYVGLDPGKLARRFREEAGKSSVKQDYTWLKPIERGRFSGGALLLVSLAIAGAAYVAWYYRTADARKPAAAVEIGRIEPATPRDVAAADAGGGAAAPDRDGGAAPPQSALPERDPEVGLAEEDRAEEDRTEEDRAGGQDGETAALPENPEAGAADRPDASGEDRNAAPEPEIEVADRPIVLRARGLVWIRVRHRQTGRVIVEGIMKEGNQVTVPDEPGLVLDVGRASQLEYLIGGRSAGLAGPAATVRHNLSLDPARLAQSADAVAARDASASGSAGEPAAPGNVEDRNTEGGTAEDRNAEDGNADAGNSEDGNTEGRSAEEQAAAAGGTVVLRALGLVWVRVRHPQTRQVLVEGIMKKGNVVAVPDDPGLVLDVGRANQLEYLVSGEPAGLAGESPGPAYSLSLDPAKLKPDG